MKRNIVPALLAAVLCTSCFEVNPELGKDLIATDQQYDIHTVTLPVEDIILSMPNDLTGLSQQWITVGALRDAEFGLTTRSAAFSLVPVKDTLDFGTDPIFKAFHFAAPRDTISCLAESQQYILQNVNVYELEEAIDYTQENGTNSPVRHRGKRITKGIPVYNGQDSLSFDFSEEFGKKYLGILQSDLDSMKHFTAKFPGIYIEMDPPMGEGGRINLFDISCFSVNNSGIYYINSDKAAELKFSAIYDGVRKDTSFFFIYGEPEFFDAYEYIEKTTRLPQYSYNVTTHESAGRVGPAVEKIPIEGGGGLKPVLSAEGLRASVREALSPYGDPDRIIINRASLRLPFEMPDDWRALKHFPTVLSPTSRILSDAGKATFANLTDASNTQENQGDIDRSNLCYSPDITHHLQELIRLKTLEKIGNYDIWFLIVSNEQIETATSTNAQNEYYQNMLYSTYYNDLYNGGGYYGGYGYGGYGYGGYGGYGYNNYSNYYSYMLMSSLMNAGSSLTTVQMLDLSRYYHGMLNGPANADPGRRPEVTIVFSVPRE